MNRGKVAAGIGAGMLAVGAAAAGYYFYASPKAGKHRKLAAKWARDMKQEVMRDAKRLGAMSAKDFAKIVDGVAVAYRSARSVDAAELRRAANELKANWHMMHQELHKSTGKKAAPAKKKAVKKAAKKKTTKK